MDFLIEKIKNNKNYQFGAFCVVLFVLSLFVELYYGPLYKGDDFYFHYRRFLAFINALMIDNTFPSYIDYNAIDGYAYLSNTFYSDIIFLPFAVLGYFIGAYNSLCFMFFIFTFLCGLFMYKAINIIYKNSFMAFCASLLYTFSLYRYIDEYTRSALGEFFSFTFLPIILMGSYHIIIGNYKKWYILTIGYSLLIYTHVLSSLIVFLFLIIFIIIYNKHLRKEPKRILYLIIAGIITFVITAYYIFPFFEQFFSGKFYFQTQAWLLPVQYKLKFSIILKGLLSGIISEQGYPYIGIGILLTVIIFARIFVKQTSPYTKSADIFVLIGIILILLTSTIAPWGRFPLNLFSVIQFPWRLYEYTTLFFAIGGAYYLSQIIKTDKKKLVCLLILIISIIALTINYANFYNNKFRENITQLEKPNKNNHYLGGGLEYIPAKNGQVDPLYVRGDSVRSLFNSSKIYSIERKNRFTHFNTITNTPDSLELPLLYYKGYTAELDGITLPVTQSNKGLVQIPVNKSGHIKAYYAGTVIQKISFYISLFSTLAFCIFILYYNRKNRFIKK